jgi:hypothetical protein
MKGRTDSTGSPTVIMKPNSTSSAGVEPINPIEATGITRETSGVQNPAAGSNE